MIERLRVSLLLLGLLCLPALAAAQEEVELLPAPDSLAGSRTAIMLLLPAAGGYEINRQKVELPDLGQQLRAIYDPRPTRVLLVAWAPVRPWKEVATVVLLAQEQGVTCYRIPMPSSQ
jgi:biopolymer transport protein ExbD